MKLSKLLIVPAALGAILYGLGMASIANAETVTFTVVPPPVCEYVDGNVVCEVTREHGIKRIGVYLNSGVGQIEVFDQSYKDCPTTVEIVLDPIVIDEDSIMHVESCKPPKPSEGVGQPDAGSFKTPAAAKPYIIGDVTNPW